MPWNGPAVLYSRIVGSNTVRPVDRLTLPLNDGEGRANHVLGFSIYNYPSNTSMRARIEATGTEDVILGLPDLTPIMDHKL